MKRLRLDLELLTPCFLGGAEQGKSAEWRAPSVRGHLRWWFRAVAGGRLGGDLSEVREAEATVFGSTDRASPLVVRTLNQPQITPAGVQALGRGWLAQELAALWNDATEAPIARLYLERNSKEVPSNPVAYLGYGPITYQKERHGFFTSRPSLAPGTTLNLELSWRRGVRSDLAEIFQEALWAWLHLGGVGGRGRRGFGALRCTKVDGQTPPQQFAGDAKQIQERACALIAGSTTPSSGAQWSHFTSQSRILLGVQPCSSGPAALEQLGAWLMSYRRRYGATIDGRQLASGAAVAGRDYQWAELGATPASEPIPDRVGFGLPLAFGGQGSKVAIARGATVPIAAGRPEDPRRASPLLGSVVAVTGTDYRPILTYLPARFLAADVRLALCKVDQQGRALRPLRHGRIDQAGAPQLEIVGRFLDAVVAAGLAQESAP